LTAAIFSKSKHQTEERRSTLNRSGKNSRRHLALIVVRSWRLQHLDLRETPDLIGKRRPLPYSYAQQSISGMARWGSRHKPTAGLTIQRPSRSETVSGDHYPAGGAVKPLRRWFI
jgi:hypothetical protein